MTWDVDEEWLLHPATGALLSDYAVQAQAAMERSVAATVKGDTHKALTEAVASQCFKDMAAAIGEQKERAEMKREEKD